MDDQSRLLLRNTDLLPQTGNILWINPAASCAWREIGDAAGKLEVFCQDYGDWRRLSEAGAGAAFGTLPDKTGEMDGIILSLPREKLRLRMLAHFAASVLPETGFLLLAGENRAGIRSSPRHLETVFEDVARVDSARHCALIRAAKPRPEKPFGLDAYRLDWKLRWAGSHLLVHSWPGVFAHGELDAGSRLLLDHLPDVQAGCSVLDFACGSGILGAAMLLREQGIRCTFSDCNALACLSTTSTLQANGLRGRVLPSDGFSDIRGRFDLIVSNPPFHVRHRADTALGTDLLAPIRNFLNPGGQFLMVANRHLPYRRWLDEVFESHDVVASDGRYHVLHARHDARARTRVRHQRG